MPELVAKVIAEQGQKPVDATTSAIVDEILGDRASKVRTETQASNCQVPVRTFKRRLLTAASAVYHGTRAMAASIISKHIRLADSGSIRIAGIFRLDAYDETPLALRIRDDPENKAEKSGASK